MIRLSIIPSHMSTAVFSTCDVKFWHFVVSTFFTLPKQLILVYLGVLLVGGKSDFWVKFGLFGVVGIITVAAAAWIWYKMASIKKDLLARQERRRAEKESRMQSGGSGGSGSSPMMLGVDDERTPLERNNSYSHFPEPQQQGYATYPTEMSSGWGQQPQQPQTQSKPGYNAYSPPREYSPPSGGGYGYAQTTNYPETGSGDLGTYGRAQYDMPDPAMHESPEQRKAVHPYGFV